MPIKTFGTTTKPSNYYRTWKYVNSPRNNKGELILKTNATSSQERIGEGTANYAGYGPSLSSITSALDVTFGTTTRSKAAYAAAYDRFRDKAWSGAQASLLVDLAERRSTMQMVGGTMMRILRGARQVSRLQFKAAARTLALDKVPDGTIKSKGFATFQQNWLAYRYGWLPLVMSAQSLLEAAVTPLPDHYHVRTSGRAPVEKGIILTNDSWTLQVLEERRTRCVIKGLVKVSNPTLANLNQYGLVNIPQTLWELVPFSFVADWFVNVGSMIEDLSSFTGLSITDVSVTYHEYVKQTYYQKKAASLPLPKAGDYYNGIGRSKRRVLMATLHRPERPFFHNGLTVKRVVDAVALAGIIFNRRK